MSIINQLPVFPFYIHLTLSSLCHSSTSNVFEICFRVNQNRNVSFRFFFTCCRVQDETTFVHLHSIMTDTIIQRALCHCRLYQNNKSIGWSSIICEYARFTVERLRHGAEIPSWMTLHEESKNKPCSVYCCVGKEENKLCECAKWWLQKCMIHPICWWSIVQFAILILRVSIHPYSVTMLKVSPTASQWQQQQQHFISTQILLTDG